MTKPTGNLPKTPLRWSLNRASTELGCTRATIQAGLVRDNVKPDANGCYSSKEIISALYGDMRGEQLRRLREDADNIALKNKMLRTELVPLGEVQLAIAAVLSALEREISESRLSVDEQESMVKHLHQFHYSPSAPGPKLIRAPSIG